MLGASRASSLTNAACTVAMLARKSRVQQLSRQFGSANHLTNAAEARRPCGARGRGFRTSASVREATDKGAEGGHVWSEEWKKLKFGAMRPSEHPETDMKQVLFIETGFGCDQHGDRAGMGATKAAVRACRNAIEFNSIPCIADLVPGGRPEMKIRIRLGVPQDCGEVDLDAVCAVFPYGKILPIELVHGGLTFQSGRVVAELGDKEDLSVIVVACITVGY